MYIDLLGLSGVRIQSQDNIIILAPPSVNSELRNIRYKADIVILGKTDDEINVAPNDESQKIFTISGPGEYEARGVFFYCLANASGQETKSLLTSLTVEDIVVTHLGGLQRPLTDKELELFEGTDILLVPVGGNGVLSPEQAADLVGDIEPRVVIPMHAAKTGLKTRYRDTTEFLKQMGAKTEPLEKVKITKKDLPQEGMDTIYLLP